MPTILSKIFLLYHPFNSTILYLIPKKLRSLLLPTSWLPYHQPNTINKTPSQSSQTISLSPHSTSKRMDSTELKRVFQMFDRNGDGRISQKEMNDSLENLGIFIPNKELTQMIEKIDINGDGCVDIDEFGALYQSIMDDKGEEKEEEDMKEAFDVFDQNGDGFITVDELRSVLDSLGIKQGRTREDCKKMIMKVDVDGDGMVNYKEFRLMMKGAGFGALS